MAKQILGPDGEVWAIAPDESWNIRSEPWPDYGVLVEACWSSRQKTPPNYVYGRVRLIGYEREGVKAGMSTWVDEKGDVLAFNPDFWRSIDASQSEAAAIIPHKPQHSPQQKR